MTRDDRRSVVGPAVTQQGRFRRLAARLFDSARNVHLLGGLICAVTFTVTGWVWAHPEAMMNGAQADRERLTDAVKLLENADQWRSDYVVYTAESESLRRRADRISRWLPTSIEWTQLEQDVREVADVCDLEVIELQEGGQHVGVRVGVVVVECQVKGAFHSINEFIQRLANEPSDTTASEPENAMRYPVWCQRIRFQRLPVLLNDKIQCLATIVMRVPYAAEGSAADVMVEEQNDA